MTQEQALNILKTGANVFLTGEPGSGKTYTINLFQKWLYEHGKNPVMTASTGIAATHINGMTIHAWCGLGIKKDVSATDMRKIIENVFLVRKIVQAEILIIDEISMLSGNVLDNVDYIIRTVRGLSNPRNIEKPFGGLQVIFVGDFFQLPPVSKRFEEKAKFAFESQAWLSADLKFCYLTEQHRQEDPEFINFLTAMRQGTITEDHKKMLKLRMITAPKDITRLFTHNDDVDDVNQEEFEKIESEIITFDMREEGIPFLVQKLKDNCLSPEKLELKVGALVMCTRNNFESGYVNGTIGKVISLDGPYPKVKSNDGHVFEVEESEWSISENGYKKASITQIPLRLAYAITVHKCQGMSLDVATIDLSRTFEYGQGYVALSRVRSLEGMYLEGLNDKVFKMHPKVIEMDGRFRKLSEI